MEWRHSSASGNAYLSISFFTAGRKGTKGAETAIAFFCHTWKLTKPLTKGEEQEEKREESHEELYLGARRETCSEETASKRPSLPSVGRHDTFITSIMDRQARPLPRPRPERGGARAELAYHTLNN